MKTNKKVAIIGLGNIGSAVAELLSKSPRSFIASGRDLGRVSELAKSWGLSAEVLDIPTAIERADLLLLAIPYGEITPFIQKYASALSGKVIIDPSNPIAPDEAGGFRKVIGETESAGQLINAQLPEGVALVKAFGTLGVESLKGQGYAEPRRVLFYAADCSEAGALVAELISDSGFAPVSVGGIEESIRLEVFGSLHEFGAAGKALTESEAKALL